MTGELDREKLVRVLGLLGSAHDGEILSAARQAERLRREAGMTWIDIVVPALPSPTREREIDSLDTAIEFALEFEDVLTDWEIGFVRSLRRQRRPISSKQRTIIEQIVDKCRAEARAA